MRGNPRIRIALVALGMVLMGLPVWRLTHAEAPAEPGKPAETIQEEALELTVTFAHAPASFEVTQAGKPILSGIGPATTFHGAWQVSLPKEGADLLLKVTWPSSTPRTAVEVQVTKSGNTVADRTFWSEGSLTEILTVLPPQP